MKKLVLVGLMCAVMFGGMGIWMTRGRPISPIAIDNDILSDDGVFLAWDFTGAVDDPASLTDLRTAIEARGRDGLGAMEAELAALQQSSESTPLARAIVYFKIGRLHAYAGRYDEAAAAIESARTLGRSAGISARDNAMLTANLG